MKSKNRAIVESILITICLADYYYQPNIYLFSVLGFLIFTFFISLAEYIKGEE